MFGQQALLPTKEDYLKCVNNEQSNDEVIEQRVTHQPKIAEIVKGNMLLHKTTRRQETP